MRIERLLATATESSVANTVSVPMVMEHVSALVTPFDGDPKEQLMHVFLSFDLSKVNYRFITSTMKNKTISPRLHQFLTLLIISYLKKPTQCRLMLYSRILKQTLNKPPSLRQILYQP